MMNYIRLSIILAFLDFSTANSQRTTNDLTVIYRFDNGVIFYTDQKNATQSENKNRTSQQSLHDGSSMENFNSSNSSLQHHRSMENLNSLSLQHDNSTENINSSTSSLQYEQLMENFNSSNSSLQHKGSMGMKLHNNKQIRKPNLEKHYQSVIQKKEQIKRNYEIKKSKELERYPIEKLVASSVQRSEKDQVFHIVTRQITREILKQILMQIVIIYVQFIMSFACTTAILTFVGRLRAVLTDM
ncbi:uncharacterized protein LOC118195960 [Stegodyphus dumicola]|uniref:uncharacterized protein LOC118195960 n=1 Tax=Stegodyphus dumicola TaxID=202533 RepID=UPI0015AB2727|nr:uncharacterized protein LOC118195960 [Stegodyphus dumicola]